MLSTERANGEEETEFRIHTKLPIERACLNLLYLVGKLITEEWGVEVSLRVESRNTSQKEVFLPCRLLSLY